jgi:hypothetical protein
MAEIEFLPPPRPSSETSERVEPPATTARGAADAPVPLTFRPLTPAEITEHVAPDYLANGGILPDPAISAFIGLFAPDGKVSYICLQLKLHAQPLVLRPGHQSFLPSLLHAAEEYILRTTGPQWVYTFTPAGKLSQLAQTAGMQLEPWCVMSKLVQPELPAKPVFEVLPSPAPIPITAEELEQHPGRDYRPTIQEFDTQERPDDSAWEGLFPNGVMGVDSSGRVQ